MNTYMEKMTKLFMQDNTEDLQILLQLAYGVYEKRCDCSGEIQRCTLELEKHIIFWGFAEQDPINSAVNALCAAYDFAAFTEGFQKGAQLILALLRGNGDQTP